APRGGGRLVERRAGLRRRGAVRREGRDDPWKGASCRRPDGGDQRRRGRIENHADRSESHALPRIGAQRYAGGEVPRMTELWETVFKDKQMMWGPEPSR